MNHICVVDFGSQHTRHLARAIRELGVFTEIVQDGQVEAALESRPAGVVLAGPDGEGGGPQLTLLRAVHARAWSSQAVPEGFRVGVPDQGVAVIAGPDGQTAGLQVQEETIGTAAEKDILERFLKLAGAVRDWTADRIVDQLTRRVQEQVGDARVLLGISGGVDSSTLGLLLHRALGERLHAVFVDHGLLRMGEAREVEEALRSLGVNLTVVDASARFLAGLEGVADPEQKRKIIGHEFIEVFTTQARELYAEHGDIRFLAQGTLYTDVIESAGGPDGVSVKSHHNVGGLPEELGFELLEPFRELFKDEVRELAGLLGLPLKMRERHPFPGPGLAIRVLGEVTPERLDIARRVDAIFVESLREFGLYGETWQALAVLTPLKSVGVAGGKRTYSHTVALRAVSSTDGMTAQWTRLPHDFLAAVSERIVAAVPEVNRVVYDITSKPPGTIEWE